jgi:hypothetical protein
MSHLLHKRLCCYIFTVCLVYAYLTSPSGFILLDDLSSHELLLQATHPQLTISKKIEVLLQLLTYEVSVVALHLGTLNNTNIILSSYCALSVQSYRR